MGHPGGRAARILRETTIHGLRHLVEGRSPAERLAWVLILGGTFALLGLVLTGSFREAQRNPLRTSVESVMIKVGG